SRTKFTMMVKLASTGSPFIVAGVYFHCLTASIAASAKPQLCAGRLKGRMSPTDPSLRTRAERTTCPLFSFTIALRGYRGGTLVEAMSVGFEKPAGDAMTSSLGGGRSGGRPAMSCSATVRSEERRVGKGCVGE